MGYTNKHIRLDFSDLGEGCYVTIRNPRLMTSGQLSAVDVEIGPDGRPVDHNAAMNAGNATIAKLIVNWCVWDPDDESDDPAVLPLPATPEIVTKLPMAVVVGISEQIEQATNPR